MRFAGAVATCVLLALTFYLPKRPRVRTRPPFLPGELDQLLTHVAYEMVMLEHCRMQLGTGDVLAFEGILLHGRNIREVLFSTVEEHGRYADNALVASDYAPHWTPNKGDHRYAVIWKTDAAADAQLAHLSRRRADKKTQCDLTGAAADIAAALELACASFRQALGMTPWGPMLDAAIAAEKHRLHIP